MSNHNKNSSHGTKTNLGGGSAESFKKERYYARTISAKESDYKKLSKIGNGSVSHGVRFLLNNFCQSCGRTDLCEDCDWKPNYRKIINGEKKSNPPV